MVDKTVLESFIKKGYLLSPELLDRSDFNSGFLNLVDSRILSKEKPVVICSDIYNGILKKGVSGINWIEFEKSKVLHERGKNTKVYASFLELIFENNKKPIENTNLTINTKEVTVNKEEPVKKKKIFDDKYTLKIIKNYGDESKLREVKDFVYHYKARYNFLRNIITKRQEMNNVISIERVKNKEKGESVTLIGLVYDKRITKKGNIMVKLEDATGTTNIIFDSKIENVDFLCFDEVIGVTGIVNEGFVYANSLIFPDIPERIDVKTYPGEVCAAFISDVHIGNKLFIEDKFMKFIDWINGKHSDPKMIELSKKIKYLFIVGDVVDGVGIYPNQDKELNIKSIKAQYDRCAELLSMIRKDIKIILCPGNHDARRIAEPQPALDSYAESLKDIDNLFLVSNPSMINVLSSEKFEGFNILMYHGYSYDYYAANIDPIMQGGGYDRGDLIMKFLLQKRHLSPAHTSTLFVPNGKEDYLVIDQIPDIFASGHIHKVSVSKYKGVTNIVGSCWQYKNDFQERVGHHPEYCKVPVFNFGTGKAVVLDFSDGLEDKS
ncbi:MAG: metallophosphoesterase [Nanoarchaeota archaeon]|nr:metallophosphoesterase [Nanoarchaeota archaeon]